MTLAQAVRVSKHFDIDPRPSCIYAKSKSCPRLPLGQPLLVVTKTICDSETMLITCPTDQAIDVTTVFYGRLDEITCPREGFMNDTSCSLPEAIDIVRSICQNQMTCSLQTPGHVDRDDDPCYLTYKHLTVTYTCRRK